MFLGQQRNQIFRCIYSKLWSAREVPIPLSKPTAKSKFSEQQCFTQVSKVHCGYGSKLFELNVCIKSIGRKGFP